VSGRAGRRGLDAKGTVVLMLAEPVEREALRSMMHGDALPLASSFRLRFNTLLRLYGMESLHPERLVAQSFYAFQRAQQIPEVQQRRQALLDEAEELKQPGEDGLSQLLALRASRRDLEAQAMAMALHPKHSLRFLIPGRLARLANGAADAAADLGWAVVLGFRHIHNRAISDELAGASGRDDFLVDVLLPVASPSPAFGAANSVKAGAPTPTATAAAAAAAAAAATATATAAGGSALGDPLTEAHIVSVRLSALRQLSAARLWLPADLRSKESRARVLAALRELLLQRHRLGTERAAEMACLHPVAHLGATEGACRGLSAQAAALKAREVELGAQLLRTSAGSAGGGVEGGEGKVGGDKAEAGEERENEQEGAEKGEEEGAEEGEEEGEQEGEEEGEVEDEEGRAHRSLTERLARLERRRKLVAAADACTQEAIALTTNEFGEQTTRMRAVLRTLGHLDDENVVQRKGRAAAEIEACDELVASELILGGVFNELTPQAVVALCACLVAESSEKVKRAQPMHADLAEPFAKVQATARAVCEVLNGCGIATDPLEFVASFDGGLVNVAYAWANGVTFDALTGLCDLFEGSIIRAIRRLSELLDELQSAAKAIGNEELFQKLEAGAKLIRRDICFAASLYIEG
jgi:superfamily II RNA helicase